MREEFTVALYNSITKQTAYKTYYQSGWPTHPQIEETYPKEEGWVVCDIWREGTMD